MENFSLYGLPDKVKHCAKCLMTNQKPHSINETKSVIGAKKTGMQIHENGQCDACLYAEKKSSDIDWASRELLLEEKLSSFRKADGRYDCIVSGSGGKDSMMVAHLLKYKYGMHPLTITYAPLNYTQVGFQNMQNWINIGGFDNLLFSPNGVVSGMLAREALKNLFHPLQPFKFGLKQYASKMALKFDIGLVMYGEPWAEYGSSTVEAANVPDFQSGWYINDDPNIFIAGLSIDELKSKLSINDNDLLPYIPLRSSELKGRRLTVENLGWYIPWDPQEAYYYAVDNCGFESDDQRTDGTYGKYASIDDKFESLHYYCHFIKFGIGRTRFDASHEIRNGHLTREEGIMLAAQYEGEFPARYHSDCLKFMNVSEEEFISITDAARSPHLWQKISGEWKLIQELPEISALKAESKI